MNKKTLSLGFIIAIVFAVTAFPTANSVPTGIADPNMVANGCTCHTDGIMASDVVINLTELPENYNVSQVYTFTLKISGGPEPLEGGNQGGFFIAASYGTLESVDNTTQVPEGQTHLTHNAYGNGQREWSFNWTAPESDSKVAVFTVYGNSVNGNAGSSNGAGGDYWNKAEFKVAGVNAKIVAEEEEMSMPQKMVYAFTVLLLTLSAVVVGNRMVVNDQSFEDVMKDYWDAAYPWLTTTDHKYIGTLYIVTGFAFFFIGGILGLLIRLQLFESDNDFLTYEEYNSTFTMHGTTMIFLAAMPIIFGFANYLIPLQLGARDLAFPRLNALSYWLLPTGGIVIYMGYFTGGAGDVGWTGYTPYSSGDTATTPGTDFWVAGQIMLGASSTLTAINFLTTMLRMRAPGMTLMRMPLFSWSIFVTVFLLLLSIPVFTVALLLLMADRTFGTLYFDVDAGGDPILWQHLFWYFGHPEVYIVILPAFGVLSEIISTFSRRPIFGYTSMVYAMATIGVISFIVYGHHMFTTGADPLFRFIVMLTTMLVAVPTGIKIFNWLATMTGGSIVLKTPMIFALGTVITFTIGGITGIILASIPVDVALHDGYFVVAHFHYVLVGGTIFSFIAGVYYWYPKMTGKMMNEKLGLLHFATSFIFFNAAFYPMHNVGIEGMPRRYATYDAEFTELNEFISITAIIFGLVQLIFVYNVFYSYKNGEDAGDDPWDGWSLEWATSSPPPHNSFVHIPTLKVAEEEHE
ncbi:MAG: cytochrome c oxidase subunit I [Candidatus Poseidoniia archaeon]|nr:cytochrome c oxidase subunit I [Candidatus Poseidoniia archaeon]